MAPSTENPRVEQRHRADQLQKAIPVLVGLIAIIAVVASALSAHQNPIQLERVDIKVGSEKAPTTELRIELFNESDKPIRIDPNVRLKPQPKDPLSSTSQRIQSFQTGMNYPWSLVLSNMSISPKSSTTLSMRFDVDGFPSSLTQIEISYFKPSKYQAISLIRSTIDRFLPEERRGIKFNGQYFTRKTQAFHADEILKVTTKYAIESGYLFNVPPP